MCPKTQINDDKTMQEIEALIISGINDILYTPKSHNPKRDYNKEPLTHNETLFLIQTLHKELEDPKLPAGLIFLYGRILDFVSEKIVYN